MIGHDPHARRDMRDDIHARIRRTAERIAESAGATAEVTITTGYPITYNDPALTERMRPTLERVAGGERGQPLPPPAPRTSPATSRGFRACSSSSASTSRCLEPISPSG